MVEMWTLVNTAAPLSTDDKNKVLGYSNLLKWKARRSLQKANIDLDIGRSKSDEIQEKMAKADLENNRPLFVEVFSIFDQLYGLAQEETDKEYYAFWINQLSRLFFALQGVEKIILRFHPEIINPNFQPDPEANLTAGSLIHFKG